MEVKAMIDLFKEFIETRYQSKLMQNMREGKNRVTVEFSDIAKFNPELADAILDNPEDSFTCADIALGQVRESVGADKVSNIRMRIRGDIPGNKVRIRDLRSCHLGKFLTIEGTIETKTDVMVKMASVVYECPACGNKIPMLQMGDEIKEPTSCGCGRKGRFTILEKKLMDCYSLRIQELSSTIKYGSDLKTVSVLCKDDLTDSIIEERLVEGIKVKINGLYNEKFILKHGQKQTQLLTFIEANYIQLSEETFYDIELSKSDIEEIQAFSHSPHLIESISEGLFSGVYGHDKIKEALVLQAFGGVSDYKATPRVRGDIHILICGDTGQNKSAFLEYVSKFTPKSVLLVGKSVSAVGMSGAVIKDELSGGYVLKPGAFPLANNGVILIDELDKMKEEDRDILHEPLEQQTISISKANISDRKMICRCSALVTMNPKNGYFNDYDMIYDQIGLPPTIINRFDLVFIIKKNRSQTPQAQKEEKEKARLMMTRSGDGAQSRIENFHKFMRKYIAYAKQNIRPVFDKHLAEEYIPEKYAQFDHERKNGAEGGKQTFPISPRHMFIIKRLAEARRRVFLDERITQEDVDYAIDRLRDSLKDIATDQKTGTLDVEYIRDGVPAATKKLVEVFDLVFDKLAVNRQVDEHTMISTLVRDYGFTESEVEKFIIKKKNYGELMFPRHGIIQKL